MKVFVFREILWDIIEGTPYLGVAPLNFAAHVLQGFEKFCESVTDVYP